MCDPKVPRGAADRVQRFELPFSFERAAELRTSRQSEAGTVYYAGHQYGADNSLYRLESTGHFGGRLTRQSFTESLILAQDERWRRA